MIRTAAAIRITNLKVPLGGYHEVPIDCQYNLEGTKLYDVKWYKDGEQFFRCLPNGDTMDYPVEGIHLYIDGTPRTGSCPLTLIGLSSRTTGEYKCEVTGEAPSFVSAAKSTRFRMMEPPSPRVQNSLKGLFDSLKCLIIDFIKRRN